MKRVLIVGGYGNFGSFIARTLARETDIQVIIAGRNINKAQTMARQLKAANPAEGVSLDVHQELSRALAKIAPDILIHTSGPFQNQGYDVALACIAQGCHYIDLADARGFVCNIGTLDQAARKAGVLVCSGASSVPTLTSAIIDHYIGDFGTLEGLDYAIATAQQTNRGLATTAAILSYVGRPFNTLIDGKMSKVYGWLDLKFRGFWGLSSCPLGNCDVPDLEIFPKRYPTLRNIRFRAGLELKILHLTLFALSWLVRLRLLPNLQRLAPYLLRVSRLFDVFGTENSGFYMRMTGRNKAGDPQEILFELLARHGDGPYIPSFPAILMAKKLARGELTDVGASPCVGFISLTEYLQALSEFDITWRVHGVANTGSD